MENLVKIGSIYKAHGVKGMMKVWVTPEYMNDLLQMEAVFIDTPDNTLPFFIKTVEAISPDTALLWVEDIDSKEKVSLLVKNSIYARENDLEFLVEEDEGILGYLVVDNQIGKIGKIIEVAEMPNYQMAKVNYRDRVVLIPMHADLIEEVDDETQKITMNLPDGFLEIF